MKWPTELNFVFTFNYWSLQSNLFAVFSYTLFSIAELFFILCMK